MAAQCCHSFGILFLLSLGIFDVEKPEYLNNEGGCERGFKAVLRLGFG